MKILKSFESLRVAVFLLMAAFIGFVSGVYCPANRISSVVDETRKLSVESKYEFAEPIEWEEADAPKTITYSWKTLGELPADTIGAFPAKYPVLVRESTNSVPKYVQFGNVRFDWEILLPNIIFDEQ